jgi:predicted O-methyltransferase YrrM
MKHLEKIDAQDRVDGTENSQRLRQIPPETGKFLSLLAASSPAGSWIEIGTSGGYSALWLSLACHECDQYLTTFELLEEKAHIARKTFEAAGVDQSIRVVVGDARESLNDVANISFCFLDSDKELYPEFYDLVIPKLVSGGIFIADNLISHEEELQSFVDNAENDESVDALVVPIGKGLLVCRKI